MADNPTNPLTNNEVVKQGTNEYRRTVQHLPAFYRTDANQRFLASTSFPRQDDLPLRLLPHKAAEIVSFEKALDGYCSVTLNDEERVTLGD